MKVIELLDKKIGVSQLPFDEFVLFERKPKSCDILVLSHNTFGRIDLQREMETTADLARLTQLSLDEGCLIFCGITTHIMGLKHISVAVADRGKLIDIVDRTCNYYGDEFADTNKVKVYNSVLGKFGILVDSDVMYPRIWEKLAPVCDIIINLGSDACAHSQLIGQACAEYYLKPLICVGQDITWYESTKS